MCTSEGPGCSGRKWKEFHLATLSTLRRRKQDLLMRVGGQVWPARFQGIIGGLNSCMGAPESSCVKPRLWAVRRLRWVPGTFPYSFYMGESFPLTHDLCLSQGTYLFLTLHTAICGPLSSPMRLSVVSSTKAGFVFLLLTALWQCMAHRRGSKHICRISECGLTL